MGLEHLNDSEYEALKHRGLTALNDDAYDRLKLPKGYGMQAKVDPKPEPEQPKYSDKKLDGLVGGGPSNDTAKAEAAGPMKDLILGDKLASNMTMGGMGLNALEGVARIGRKAKEGLGMMGALVGPKTERAMNIGSDFLLPQNKLSAAALGLGEAASADKALDVGTALAKSRVRVIQPNKLERVAGGGISVTTRVPERFSSAVVADTSILDKTVTPSVKEVSQEMGQFFQAKGTKINSEAMNELFDQDFIPSDNQVSKLQKIVKTVRTKLEAGYKGPPVTDEELVFAERAANAMSRSTQAAQNRSIMSVAKGNQKLFLDQLDKAGFTELPELKAKYFRALAQDAFQEFLPRNKTGGPNALSGLLMAKQGVEGVEHLIQGSVGKAVGSAIKGAVFSPLLVGNALKGASKLSVKALPAAKSVTMATLNQLNKKKK